MLDDNGVTLENCKKFANNAITHRQITENNWTRAQGLDMEYREYEDQLNEDELIYIKKFYNEMYANRIYIPEDYRLVNNEDMIKESNRINNRRNRDLMEVKGNRGQLDSLTEANVNHVKINIDDSQDWHCVYDMFGYEFAMNFIIDSFIDELNCIELDKRLTAIRFYIKMNKLKKMTGAKNFRKALKEKINE
jgi:hypothetical protein